MPDDEPLQYENQIHRSDLQEINVGIDFGGNLSGHSFVVTGYTGNYEILWALKSKRYMNADFPKGIDANMLQKLAVEFVADVQDKYGAVDNIYWDNAETTLGQSIRNAIEDEFPNVRVYPAIKTAINNRIKTTIKLMGADRFRFTDDCETLEKALTDAVYNSKIENKDERLDDGSTDIDTLDAFEYTFERDMNYLIEE